MYLKATIQKVTDFGYFANFGREQTFEQSNWDFGTANNFFLLLFYLYFLSRLFILSGCGMVGKICGGKKNLSLNCQALVRVLARYSKFDRGTPIGHEYFRIRCRLHRSLDPLLFPRSYPLL
jgi:hypothetical protein